MGFINNYTDNFLPSNGPWGDDNIVVYNTPNANGNQSLPQEAFDASNLGYEQLVDMQNQLVSAISVLPQCPKKLRLRQKLMIIDKEISKRDELEAISAKDRDDNFDIKDTTVKEDMEPAKPKPKPILSVEEPMNEVDDLEECYGPYPQQMGMGNMTGFLIASLIIIIAINMTKK